MKRFRTVFLPLLLCCAILLSGYFSPVLFDKLTPDLRNKVEPISIAAADTPMYLESTDEVLLPPWDDIVIYQADSLMNTFALAPDEQSALSEYIAADIAALFPNIRTDSESTNNDLIDALQIYQNQLLFLQDYSCSFYFTDSADYTPCTLDLVIDGRTMFPTYMHLREKESLPVTDDAELRNCMKNLIDQLQYDVLRDYMEPIDSIRLISKSNPDAYTVSLAQAMLGLFSRSELSCDIWWSILLACRDIYTLTYENESLLVLVGDQNLTCCLFFDALTNHITGYSIDPNIITNRLMGQS